MKFKSKRIAELRQKEKGVHKDENGWRLEQKLLQKSEEEKVRDDEDLEVAAFFTTSRRDSPRARSR